MKLYTYDSSFEEKLKEIKSHYKDCSFKGAVQPMMYGHQWQYIGEIQGTLTDEAYQDLKIKTYLKIIFSFGLALCFESVRQNLQTIRSSIHREIKPIYIAITPDTREVIERIQKSFNTQVQQDSQVSVHSESLIHHKLNKEKVLAKEKLSLTDFPDFNDDEDVVRKAVLGNPHEFQFASQRLKDKKEFVLELLEPRRDNVFIIEYLSSSLKDDDEVAEKFMSISPGSYAYLGPTQKKKIAFAQACIDYSPLEAFAHMPEDLKKNKELAKLGFIKNPSCYMHFDEDLKRDQPFFLDILRSTSNQFDCVKMYPVLRKVLGEDKVRQEFQAKGMAMNTDGTFLIGNS